MSYIDITDLTFSYTKQGPLVLENQQLSFQQATFNVLTGPSGSGKSTLLRLLCGLFPQYTGHLQNGQILLDGEDIAGMDISKRAQKIAMLFQVPAEQFAMPTPRQELIFTLENMRIAPEQMDQRITQAFEFTGISEFADREFSSLSGGEQQKVALAIILALDADTILLDEPFANVDPKARNFLLRRLKQLVSNRGKTVIIADHDLSDYQQLADYLYVMEPTQKQIHLATEAETQQRFLSFEQNRHQQISISLPDQTDTAEFKLRDFSTGHQKVLLKQANFELMKHHLTVFTGPNGVGKSTLFNSLTKLQDYQGSLTWENNEIAKLKVKDYSRHVALVFQEPISQFLKVTVAEELELSLHNQYDHAWTKERVRDTLADLGLTGFDDHVVYMLSEGQKRKLQILLMLIMGVPTLLLDEPLTGLDLVSVHKIMQLLQQAVRNEDKTVIMISHQLTDVADYADYHISLHEKELSYEASL